MRGVFLDLASLAESDLDLSELNGLMDDWRTFPATAPSDRLANIADAQIVVTNKVVLDREIMAASPGLELICLTATGYNNVDLDAAREHGVAVSNVVAYATDSVVQHVFALMLAHHTRLIQYEAAVRRGDWSHSEQFCLLDYPVRELHGMTLGIVGYGELGRGVAAVAQAFGMRILISQRPGAEPRSGRTAFADILRESDVLTLHVPLLDSTRHLVDRAALAKMKRDALLINTSRGAVVDNRALADALRAGIIGGAALDVLDEEPPPIDHPLLAGDIPNLIITPHTAWAGRGARQKVVDETMRNIRAYTDGRSRNRLV